MKGTTIAGLILIVFGIQGLIYGLFNLALASDKTGHAAASLQHTRQKITLPISLGAGGIVIGGLLIVMGGRERRNNSD